MTSKAKTYDQRLKAHINTCGNTTRVYILHGSSMLAFNFAVAAAKSAFKLHPELRDEIGGRGMSNFAIGLTNAYYLRLAAIGIPTRDHRVFSSDEAVAVWTDFRDHNNLGSSDMKKGCGDVHDAKGQLVARISYNGRVWDTNNKPIDGLSGSEWIAA